MEDGGCGWSGCDGVVDGAWTVGGANARAWGYTGAGADGRDRGGATCPTATAVMSQGVRFGSARLQGVCELGYFREFTPLRGLREPWKYIERQ